MTDSYATKKIRIFFKPDRTKVVIGGDIPCGNEKSLQKKFREKNRNRRAKCKNEFDIPDVGNSVDSWRNWEKNTFLKKSRKVLRKFVKNLNIPDGGRCDYLGCDEKNRIFFEKK